MEPPICQATFGGICQMPPKVALQKSIEIWPESGNPPWLRPEMRWSGQPARRSADQIAKSIFVDFLATVWFDAGTVVAHKKIGGDNCDCDVPGGFSSAPG